MKATVISLLLTMSHVCSGQLLNSSFENWTFNAEADLNSEKWILNDWIHCDKNGDPLFNLVNLFGTYKDSTAQSGSFALTLSRWYSYTFDVAKFKNKYDTKPTSLSGFYRYTENILSLGKPDTAQIAVYLTRFNPANQTIDTIGSGVIDLAATSNYTGFQCPISYNQQNLAPDSITIVLRPSKFKFGVGGCLNNPWCSYLTVDDIQLSGSSGTAQVNSQAPFQIFPNPATASITVNGPIFNKTIIVTDILGRTVYRKVAASDHEMIETGYLAKGVYWLSINGRAEKLVIE